MYLQRKHYYVKGLPFSFAHISDLHFGDHPNGNPKFPLWLRDELSSAISHSNVNVLFITGDIVDRRGDNNVSTSMKWINSLSTDINRD